MNKYTTKSLILYQIGHMFLYLTYTDQFVPQLGTNIKEGAGF